MTPSSPVEDQLKFYCITQRHIPQKKNSVLQIILILPRKVTQAVTLVTYFGGVQFESRSGHRLHKVFIVVFLSPSKQMMG
jgi:hypothetical protein